MGMNLADTPPLEGMDWGVIRQVLGAVAGRDGPYRLVQRKTGSIDDFALVGAIEACLMHGLIEDVREKDTALTIKDLRYINRFRVTEKGDLIRAAALRPRMKRKEALRRLQEFLQNCVKTNADDELPTFISSVWLVGSLLKGKEEVGDIDLAVSWDQRPFYRELIEKDRGSRYVRDLARKRNLPDHLFGGVMAYPNLRSGLQQRALFGARKPTIFSLIEVDTVVAMHDTCQCLFDADRGGIVDDPVLPHHPDSKERGKEMLDPFMLPDFEDNLPVRPCDASWLAKYETFDLHRGAELIDEHPKGQDYYGTPWIYDDARLLSRGHKRQIVGEDLARLNGREGVIFAVTYDTGWGIDVVTPHEAVYVARKIDGGTVDISIRELSGKVRMVGKDSTMAPWLALQIAAIAMMDAWRLHKAGREDVTISLALGVDPRARRNHGIIMRCLMELEDRRAPEDRFTIRVSDPQLA